MANCPQCAAEISDLDAFCQKCGHQLQAGAQRKEAPQKLSRLGSLAQEQHKKHIKSARTAILVVAILTFLGAILLYFIVQSEIAKVKSTPGMVVDETAVGRANMIVAAVSFMGCIFLGLWVWAKSNPFSATVTALVLYLSLQLLNAAMDPTTIVQGIIIKIIIVLVLINGVKSGLAFKKLQEAGE